MGSVFAFWTGYSDTAIEVSVMHKSQMDTSYLCRRCKDKQTLHQRQSKHDMVFKFGYVKLNYFIKPLISSSHQIGFAVSDLKSYLTQTEADSPIGALDR